ncbi:hypothetical protein D3C78_1275450 [compost metagenome]
MHRVDMQALTGAAVAHVDTVFLRRFTPRQFFKRHVEVLANLILGLIEDRAAKHRVAIAVDDQPVILERARHLGKLLDDVDEIVVRRQCEAFQGVNVRSRDRRVTLDNGQCFLQRHHHRIPGGEDEAKTLTECAHQ